MNDITEFIIGLGIIISAGIALGINKFSFFERLIFITLSFIFYAIYINKHTQKQNGNKYI